MRIAAIILNLIMLVVISVIVASEGFPSLDDVELYFLLFMVATPVVTLVALFFGQADTWLALYFKRKAAEERKRIAEVEGEMTPKQPPEPDKRSAALPLSPPYTLDEGGS